MVRGDDEQSVGIFLHEKENGSQGAVQGGDGIHLSGDIGAVAVLIRAAGFHHQKKAVLVIQKLEGQLGALGKLVAHIGGVAAVEAYEGFGQILGNAEGVVDLLEAGGGIEALLLRFGVSVEFHLADVYLRAEFQGGGEDLVVAFPVFVVDQKGGGGSAGDGIVGDDAHLHALLPGDLRNVFQFLISAVHAQHTVGGLYTGGKGCAGSGGVGDLMAGGFGGGKTPVGDPVQHQAEIVIILAVLGAQSDIVDTHTVADEQDHIFGRFKFLADDGIHPVGGDLDPTLLVPYLGRLGGDGLCSGDSLRRNRRAAAAQGKDQQQGEK